MTEKELFALKNGTDIRGTAIAGVEGDPVTLTEEAVRAIGKAFCLWLVQTRHAVLSETRIAIGHDSRLSASAIEGWLSDAVASCGAQVVLTGLSSTPSMFMLLKDGFGADASVMITASHLPYQKNGLKFFVPEGGLESEDITAILHLVGTDPAPAGRGTVTRRSYLETYAAALVEKVRRATGTEKPLAGKRIVVDAGNGAGGFYASLVLVPLGADTTGSQFLDPDGRFPNHIPNPENADAMRSVSRAVVENHADFGIIFDTDVDRAGAVAADGEEINRNRLIALISAILLEEKQGAYIVTDSVTSDGLASFIAAHGGVHHRFKRGYKNVINEAKRLNAEGKYAPLAIETSGHAALMENYFLDDGAYLVTRLLIALAKKGNLESLISGLPEPKEAAEVRPTFKTPDFKAAGAKLLDEFKTYCASLPYAAIVPNNYEGVRVNFDEAHGGGWALMRMSLHEPILPINAESEIVGGNKLILAELYKFLRNYPFLDLSSLEKKL